MSDQEPNSVEHLEQARDVIWDALQLLEHAQRVLFLAGDRYVEDVWGDGVRRVIEITERMADINGDISAVHIDIGRLSRTDQARGK
jgi:hypothetical protein